MATSLSGVPPASSPHPKSPVNPKQKVNGVGGGKHDFFNSIRKQSVMKNGVSHHHHHPELSCGGALTPSSVSSLSNSVMKSDEQVMGGDSAAFACQEKNVIATSNSGLESPVADNGNANACEEEPEAMVAPDDEEKAFLCSLGWNENAGEGALTAEEILSFVKKVKQNSTNLSFSVFVENFSAFATISN